MESRVGFDIGHFPWWDDQGPHGGIAQRYSWCVSLQSPIEVNLGNLGFIIETIRILFIARFDNRRIPSGNDIQKAIEHGHRNSGFSH